MDTPHNTPSRSALVLGASGGVGGEIASALLSHGWQVRALVRDSAKAQSSARGALSGIEWVSGDAMNAADVLSAATDVQLIVHAVNPPGYRDWDRLVLPMLENSIAAARIHGARIALPGTVYNFGPDAFPTLRIDSPQNPLSSKGRIRAEMENRLKAASQQGVPVLIIRAGDFFGPHPGNNWFSQGLVKPGTHLKSISYPGTAGVGHTWAYLPDLGETFARLADIQATLPTFARYHFAGYWDADGTAITSAIKRALKRQDITVKALPWGILAIVALFNETVRGLREVRLYWQRSVSLDNSELVKVLGEEPHTPLEVAIQTTLHSLKVT